MSHSHEYILHRPASTLAGTAADQSSAVQPPALTPLPSPWSPQVACRLMSPPYPTEARWVRWTCLGLALAITIGFFVFVHHYYAPGPGTPGIDENAYMVGGRLFAERLSPGLNPSTPYAYVGPMWVRAPSGWYYPKYPLGVPALNAICIWVWGGDTLAACYTSPICATLAVLGMFLLARAMAGSFMGLLAAIVLASNPTLLHLALVPSSHAPAIGFAVWGMYALVAWLRSGKLWVGAAAGFLIGCTVTIRYSEGLLALPLGIAALTMIRWTHWRSYARAAAPVLAWLVPVAALAIFNRVTLGSWTGYDSTNESTGFTIEEFKNKWEYTIQQLHMYGLFLILPLGVVGMLLMFGRMWRVALVMTLWFFPSAALYAAYYWGLQSPGVGFLRFFLTLYPPVIAAAVWVLSMACRGAMVREDAQRRLVVRGGWSAVPIGAAVCVFIATLATAGIYVARPEMQRQYVHNANMAFSARQFLTAAPAAQRNSGKPKPLLLGEDGGMFSRTLMYMQFVGDGEWYSTTAFTPRGAGRGMMGPMGGGRRPGGNAPGGPAGQADDSDTPVLFDPARRAYTQEIYGKLSTEQLEAEEKRILNEALDGGREVYAVVTKTGALNLGRRLAAKGFAYDVVAAWTEPLSPASRTIAGGPMPGGPGGPMPGGPMPGGPMPGAPGGAFGPPMGPGGPMPAGPGGPGGAFAPPGAGGRDRFAPQGRPGANPPQGNPGAGRRGTFGGRSAGGLAPPGGMGGAGPQDLQVLKITRR